MKNVSLGMWVDLPRREILTPDFVRWYAEELNFDMMAVMIDQSDADAALSFNPKDVERLCNLLDPYAIELVLTTWAYPRRPQIESLIRQMDVLLAAGPVAGWENDLEFNWKGSAGVLGFSSLDTAGDFLVKGGRELCDKHQCRFEVTSLTGHPENTFRADVTPHVDRVRAQAYSIAKRPDGKNPDGSTKYKIIPWESVYGPGKMQNLTLGNTSKIPGISDGQPEVGAGLAAWSQDFAGHSEEEAMTVALSAALSHQLPVCEVCWWSVKHVYKKRKEQCPALSFLSSLR